MGLLLPAKRGESLELAVASSLRPSVKNREELIFNIALSFDEVYIRFLSARCTHEQIGKKNCTHLLP